MLKDNQKLKKLHAKKDKTAFKKEILKIAKKIKIDNFLKSLNKQDMKLFKMRFNCTSFHDIVVKAENKEEALNLAQNIIQCPQDGMEFGEWLDIEEGDEPDNF